MELGGEGENVKYLTETTAALHREQKGWRCSVLEQKILCVLSFLSINENRSLWLEYGFKCIDKSPNKY